MGSISRPTDVYIAYIIQSVVILLNKTIQTVNYIEMYFIYIITPRYYKSFSTVITSAPSTVYPPPNLQVHIQTSLI